MNFRMNPKSVVLRIGMCMAVPLAMSAPHAAWAQSTTQVTSIATTDSEYQKMIEVQKQQSEKSLDATSSRDLSIATLRLRRQSDAYAQYLAQKGHLTRQLQEQNAVELKRYETLLTQELQSNLQTKFKVKEDEDIAKIKGFAELKLKQVNAVIVEFETQRRAEVYKQVSAFEAQLRQATLTEVRRAEQVAQAEIQSKLLAKRLQLQLEAKEKINALQLAEVDASSVSGFAVDPSGGARDFAVDVQPSRAVVRPIGGSQVQAAPNSQLQSVPFTWSVTPYDGTLRSLLLRWAGQAGWSLVWELDVDYPISISKGFSGTFEQAVTGLFKDEQAQSGVPVKLSLFPENKVVRVFGQQP